jgi:dienelactone hydrolase
VITLSQSIGFGFLIMLRMTFLFFLLATNAWAQVDYQTVGVKDKLPVFYESMRSRLDFPLAWHHQQNKTFAAWREEAQDKVRASWLSQLPTKNFDPVIVASKKFDGYTSHKIAFNISADSRVLAYLLVPEGRGPFPAVLLLHDHGAEFRIGKEKMVRPWNDSQEKMELADKWVNTSFGGRYVGEELARRGYVCLATDALNWSDRGGGGYDNQQAIASNLMQLGMTYAGLISQEDLQAAEFLATRSEVDTQRIAALGFSMGSNRAWHVAAMSEHIAAGLCICSMASLPELMAPGINITQGQSSFTMLHPGLSLSLDIPDVASIACPKPMLFYNGRQDKIYPVPAVETAYTKLRHVWKSQRASDKLATKLWDVPHVFNFEMQDEAFAWLDQQLKNHP